MGVAAPSSQRVSEAVPASAPTGLRNLGNTCYMNAALQCLFQAHAFNKVLANSQNSRLAGSYFTLLRQQKKVRNLFKIKGEMKKVDKGFAGFKQQDASEFLSHFFDRLLSTTPEVRDEFDRLFSVSTQLAITCKLCSNVITSESSEKFLSLPLIPARVAITVRSGEPGVTDVVVEGSELMLADFLVKEVKRILGKEHIWLVVQSQRELTKVVSNQTENLKKLEVANKSIFFYEVSDSECLAEIKVYRKRLLHKSLLTCIVKKLPRRFESVELRNRLVEELQQELSVRNITLLTDLITVGCGPFGKKMMDLSLGEFGNALQGEFPIIRILAIVENDLLEIKSLPILVTRSSESLTLDSLLSHFHAPESQFESISCTPCQISTEHIKQSRLSKLSHYLILALQRYNSLDGSKDTRHVKFSLSLDLKLEETSHRYELFAVVQHHGLVFTSGHYTSCVRFGSVWYICNDSDIVEIAAEEVEMQVQTDAYLLFYEEIVDS